MWGKSTPLSKVNNLQHASQEIKHVNRSRTQAHEDPLAPRRIGSKRPGFGHARRLNPGHNSVLTTIRILEQKGYVDHRQEGRAFIYRPLIAEHEASRTEVRHVLNRFFGNSREQLLLSLLGDSEVSREELERLKAAINSAAPADTEASDKGDKL